jgi:predicted TIM-barrel fold metal-dependent hydrolase
MKNNCTSDVFYQDEVFPYLPEKILDFHAHIWSYSNWKYIPWETEEQGASYMVTETSYLPEQLIADGKRCFNGCQYSAVCFGNPTPSVDWEKQVAFVAEAVRNYPFLFPLVVAGKKLGISSEKYKQILAGGRFYGFKVFINWSGDAYDDTRVQDMIGPCEAELANEMRLVILLHVPGIGRLADSGVQKGVEWLAKECPEGRIVLAHCGRCYTPQDMKKAAGFLKNLPNVFMDTSMVMDPVVIEIALDATGPSRLVFGTDFPVAAMRGRRVRVMDHWVDVVLEGYPKSAYRVASSSIRATFMAREIAFAVICAAELCGIKTSERAGIFYDNGIGLLNRVAIK